jgi:hypothetical protein
MLDIGIFRILAPDIWREIREFFVLVAERVVARVFLDTKVGRILWRMAETNGGSNRSSVVFSLKSSRVMQLPKAS